MRRTFVRSQSVDTLSRLQVNARSWTWDCAKHLFHLKRSTFLGLPKGAMTLSQDVVGALDFDEKKLRNSRNLLTVVDVPSAMNQYGIVKKTHQEFRSNLSIMTDAELDVCMSRMRAFTKVKKDAEGFAWKLRRVLRAKSNSEDEQEECDAATDPVEARSDRVKVIDTLTWQLMDQWTQYVAVAAHRDWTR